MRPAIVLDEDDSLWAAKLASTALLVVRRLLSGSPGLSAGPVATERRGAAVAAPS